MTKRQTKKPRKGSPKTMAEPEPLRTRDLFLDPKNPRLTSSDFSVTDQDPILARLWSEFNVAEIVDSILANNEFWQHEPLIAAKENGKLIVVEGNRRLAAVQLLLSRDRQKKVGATGIPEISHELEEHLSSLPVIQSTRSDVWEFIGFKHVK